MAFISSDMSALPAHLRALFEQSGKQPGPAVGGYGSGVAPTTGYAPPTGGYISPFGGSPFPYNVDFGGVGASSKPGGYGAAPEKAPGEVLPSTPMRVRPLSRTQLLAMKRGYRSSNDTSQYLPRNYVQAQMKQANVTPQMKNYYG